MIKNTIFTIFCLLFIQTIFAQSNPKATGEQYNQQGQLIKQNRISINYSQKEMEQFLIENPKKITPPHHNFDANLSASNPDCETLWQDAIFGTCIGNNNSLIPFDLDNDGTMELITNASYSGFAIGGYWYILKYNSSKSSYEKVHISALYEEDISKLALVDLQDDGSMQLLLGIGNNLEIVDINTLSTSHNLSIPGIETYEDIRQIRYEDANNDGVKEIVLSTDELLVFINGSSWEIENSFMIDAGDFDIGNVDADANLETVFTHGATLEFNAQGTFTSTDFNPGEDNPNGFIELSDIDGDGFEEAINAQFWNRIVVYDVDLLSPKRQIDTDQDINALLMYDLDNDGNAEILYGDGQWGSLYAHDAITGQRLWTMNNPEHGTTGIAIADFDNDGTTEITWGSGCSSSGSDYLYFNTLSTRQNEWQSIHIDGPFYAIEIADVDEDGQQEIITISYESESGYSSGILTIYDAITKNIEFRSDGFFFSNIWTGVYNFEIADFGDDGDLDIVLAAGITYDGHFWVIDGDTHTIEAEQGFSYPNNIGEFYALEMEDVDGDNATEIIAVNNDRLYVFDQNFNIEWSSVSLFAGPTPQGILAGNLDDDSNNEFVVCKAFIYRYDDTNYTQAQTTDNFYNAIHLYDWDGDGKQEILAGTTDGRIQVLNGVSLQVITSFNVSLASVNGIKDIDLDNDGTDEFLITSGQQVIFLNKSGTTLASQNIAINIGEYDAIEVADYDNDGVPNIILGTAYSLMELNPSCSQCLWFEAATTSVDLNCFGDSNGSGTVMVTAGVSPFSYQWSDGSLTNNIDSLGVGTYTVLVQDSLGCSKLDSISISSPSPLTTTFDIVTDDPSTPEPEGSLTANVNGGTPPYSFNWDTGDTTNSIDQLSNTTYQLLITDNNGCILDTLIELFVTTSITNLNDQASFQLFPNPNTGTFTIQNADLASEIYCQLYSASGKLLQPMFRKSKEEENQYQFDFSNLISGYYYLRIRSDNKSYVTGFSVLR